MRDITRPHFERLRAHDPAVSELDRWVMAQQAGQRADAVVRAAKRINLAAALVLSLGVLGLSKVDAPAFDVLRWYWPAVPLMVALFAGAASRHLMPSLDQIRQRLESRALSLSRELLPDEVATVQAWCRAHPDIAEIVRHWSDATPLRAAEFKLLREAVWEASKA